MSTRAKAAAVALCSVAVALLAWYLAQNPVGQHPTQPPKPTRTPAPEKPPDPVRTPVPGTLSGLPVHPDSTGARHTTRQFLKEYLPFSYGNAPGDLNDAAPEFKAQLLADPPRAPASMGRTTAKVLLVQVKNITQNEAATSAWVLDSHDRHYVVKLTLEKHGRWMVTGLS